MVYSFKRVLDLFCKSNLNAHSQNIIAFRETREIQNGNVSNLEYAVYAHTALLTEICSMLDVGPRSMLFRDSRLAFRGKLFVNELTWWCITFRTDLLKSASEG